jgi:competence protein ComEA
MRQCANPFTTDHMSEAFEQFMAKREADSKAQASSQQWFWILLAAAFAVVMLIVLLRGDPSNRPLNPNIATEAELVTLPEVGPEMAKAIIAKRTERAFEKPEDMLDVKGIGPKTLEKMKPRLQFGLGQEEPGTKPQP